MREHAKSVSWRDGSSQQARAEVAVAYVFFPYVLMYVVRNPSVPDWDRDGNLTLPYLTVEYGFWVCVRLVWTQQKLRSRRLLLFTLVRKGRRNEVSRVF